jgi:transcriptional regulator with XRE-family HTH domain
MQLKETRDPVGLRVRRMRLQHALTQDDLARKAGLSRQALYRLELGERVRPSTLRKIAAALGVEPTKLTIGR